jgi:methionine-gamma-lyase
MTDIRTTAVHAGQEPDRLTGAISTGIVQSTAYAFGSFERGEALFAGTTSGWTYSRSGNPTTAALEAKLAALESGQSAVTFGTGMAALSAIVLSLLSPGDEIVFLGPLYGGAESYLRGLAARFGIKAVPSDGQDLETCLTSATRLIWIETPTNPTLHIHDLAAAAAIARARGILTVVDNTFATPCLTRPIEHGIDLVMHSMTKYLGGHGDAIGGAVVGPQDVIEKIRKTGLDHLGGSLAPHVAFLILRGIKTLPLRMAAHCSGAMEVAEFLQRHSAVQRVYYPGLTDHPGHGLAKRQMSGSYGGIVSFELAQTGRTATGMVLDRLRLFTQAVSLGDVNSLACHPASTTHSFVSAEVRAQQGISDKLIRLSVGIEHPADLIADLRQALNDASETRAEPSAARETV